MKAGVAMIVIVVVFCLIWSVGGSIRAFYNYKRQVRLEELRVKTELQRYAAIKRLSEEETKRTEIILRKLL